jgi:hypothetical protein
VIRDAVVASAELAGDRGEGLGEERSDKKRIHQQWLNRMRFLFLDSES